MRVTIENVSILFWILLPTLFCQDDNFFGPAEVILEGIEECENPELYLHPMNLTLVKINRTHDGMFGCYTLPSDMDESYKYNLTFSIWGDGGWKPNAYDMHGNDLCKTIKCKAPDQWKNIVDNLKAEDSCPLKKGTYCANGLRIYLEKILPSMMYGTFKSDLILTINDTLFTCIEFIANVIPKKGEHEHRGWQ